MMTQAVRWVDHKGKRILVSDYTGLKEQEYVAALEATRKELLRMPKGSYQRMLNVVTDTDMTTESAAKGRQIVEAMKERGLVGPRAMVGGSEMSSTVARMMADGIYVARTVGEAKDWLASQKEP